LTVVEPTVLRFVQTDEHLVIELHHTHLCRWLQPAARLGVSACADNLGALPASFMRKAVKPRENFGLQ
jgi:hypothetical protein